MIILAKELDICNCSTGIKRITTREDSLTPTAHGDSTIGVLPLASSCDAPLLHPRWLAKKLWGEIVPHEVVLSLLTFATDGLFA